MNGFSHCPIDSEWCLSPEDGDLFLIHHHHDPCDYEEDDWCTGSAGMGWYSNLEKCLKCDTLVPGHIEDVALLAGAVSPEYDD